jgi:ElaB/YqjD/DUF883 family membrane-anchored ribosome-binding protein
MNATLATAIATNGAGRAKEAVGAQFEELFDGVDDLIRRVADTENPEIRKIRARVHFALVAAKGAVEDGAIQPRPQAAQADEAQLADGIDDDIRAPEPTLGVPGPALGVALLLGLGLGLIVSMRQ